MPYDTDSPPPLASQARALHALARLAHYHPDLPGAYVVSHSLDPEQIDVQLHRPSLLETWRTILGISTGSVTFTQHETRAYLEFTAPVDTSILRVYAVFPRASAASNEV